jgi:hypothetical protein
MSREYASTTTLRRIKKAKFWKPGWETLLSYLGKTEADDEPLDLLTVLDSNGFADALWVLSYAMPDDRLARHFQAWCAEQVLPIYKAAHPKGRCIQARIATLRKDDVTSDEWFAALYAAENAVFRAKSKTACYAALAAIEDDLSLATDAATEAAELHDGVPDYVTRSAQAAQLRKMLMQEATQ